MKKQSFIFFIFLITSFQLNSQHYGYLGKKNFIDVKTVSSVPILANILWALSEGDGYFGKWEFGAFNPGVHVNLGRSIKQNVALSLESGIDFMSYDIFEASDASNLRLTNRCFSIMPKVEFSNIRFTSPLGISHQIGLGYYRLSGKLSYKDYIPYEFEPLNGVTLMYAFMLRTAISKKILINYGARYTLNYSFGYDSFLESLIPYYVSEVDFQKRYNFVSLELGLSYVF